MKVIYLKIAMILTNGFDPDPRVYKEAVSLTRMGHKIEILCWDRECKYLGKGEEILNDIKIIRYFNDSQYGTGYKQAAKLLKFKNWVQRYIEENNFDAIHCHDFDGLVIGYIVNNRLKLKLVYDEHDLFYTYFSNRKGILNKIVYKAIQIIERYFLRRVDNHIVVTPKMVNIYKNISKDIIVINNAPTSKMFLDTEKNKSDILRIGYIGSVRYLNELKILADVAQKFKNKISVSISGRGIALDELEKHCSSYSNVKITGAFSMDQLQELYKNIDITYAFYPSEVSTISMPNKFYESIITNTPIIANKDTEFGKEVEKKNLGFALSEDKLDIQLEEVMYKLIYDSKVKDELIENMNEVKKEYFWEANEPKLMNVYSNR